MLIDGVPAFGSCTWVPKPPAPLALSLAADPLGGSSTIIKLNHALNLSPRRSEQLALRKSKFAFVKEQLPKKGPALSARCCLHEPAGRLPKKQGTFVAAVVLVEHLAQRALFNTFKFCCIHLSLNRHLT